jgi:hypothetical protein
LTASLPAPLSPAGATSTTPLAFAAATAACSAGLPPTGGVLVVPEPDRLGLVSAGPCWAGSTGRSMTVAPMLAAYRMPAAMARGRAATRSALLSEGSPGLTVTRTDMILAAGAMPMMPWEPPGP